MIFQRGPLRLFYTIFKFDPNYIHVDSQTPPSETVTPTSTVAGSTFQITDSVTVTDIAKSPSHQSSIADTVPVASDEGNDRNDLQANSSSPKNGIPSANEESSSTTNLSESTNHG